VRNDQRPVYYVTGVPGPAAAALLGSGGELYGVQAIDLPELERVSDHRPNAVPHFRVDVSIYRLGEVSGAVRFPLTINIGATQPAVYPLLARGFYPAENDGRDAFRWTEGNAAVRLPSATPAGPTLHLRLSTGVRPTDAPEPVVAVSCGGTVAATFVAPERFADQTITLPLACRGGDEMTLDVPTWQPSAVAGGDRRRLGVRLAQVTILGTGEDTARP
jgi:hypothetical protein